MPFAPSSFLLLHEMHDVQRVLFDDSALGPDDYTKELSQLRNEMTT